MDYLLYLIFQCDRRCDGCDGKFGNLVGTKHTLCLDTPKNLTKTSLSITSPSHLHHIETLNVANDSCMEY